LLTLKANTTTKRETNQKNIRTPANQRRAGADLIGWDLSGAVFNAFAITTVKKKLK
jgi:hypothetical protein